MTCKNIPFVVCLHAAFIRFYCVSPGEYCAKLPTSMQNEVQIHVLKTSKEHLSDLQVTQFAAQWLELYICYVVIVNIYMLFVVCVNQFDTNDINNTHVI